MATIDERSGRPFSTRGGARVPHRKNTADFATVIMPPPTTVKIPMSQHIGAPCVPTVAVGDEVKLGQVIGDTDKFVSAPVHASVSGKVKAIEQFRTAGGMMTSAVVIESDGLMTPHPGIAPLNVTDKAGLVAAVRASGLVGLGGAGFPVHIKLSPPADKKIDYLVINCAECEPYITADYRECMEYPDDIANGVRLIKKLLQIDKAYIAIEDNKPEAIKLLTEKTAADADISVITLKSRYPQGAERTIIHAVTGRTLIPGKLPSDIGVIVMNITSVGFISRYIKTGMPLCDKRITLDGGAVTKPGNYRVPIGTSIDDIAAFAGGFNGQPRKILFGGPMMGQAVSDTSLPVVKNTNAVLLFDSAQTKLYEPSACIRCGRCIEACPMGLIPTSLYELSMRSDVEGLKKSQTLSCMECGCCAFVCPAKRPIVQTIRMAKQLIRSSEPKKG